MDKREATIEQSGGSQLDSVIQNWMATLFAYQPEVYFQIDDFRRGIHNGFVSQNELNERLLTSGLLQIQPDQENDRTLKIKLDDDVFPRAKGKEWVITANSQGTEYEIKCIHVPEERRSYVFH